MECFSPSSSRNTNPLFIVVIDDSPTVCHLLECLLTQEGHQVQCFQHGGLALRSIFTGQTPLPDLFFIDLSLPNIDGFEVVKRLRENPTSKHIPIIIVSRLGDAVSRLKARLAGANAYLEKPFQAQNVLALVESIAGNRPNSASPQN